MCVGIGDIGSHGGELVFEAQVVRYHGDELRVCRFSPRVLDGVSEVGIECIHITPVPCDFDGVADSSLHA